MVKASTRCPFACGNSGAAAVRPRRRAGSLLVCGLLALAMAAGCLDAHKPAATEGLVQLTAGTPAEAPAWARAELEMFAAYREAFQAFLARGVQAETGFLIVPVTNWGTADDIAEGIAVWDRYLFLVGDEAVRKAYVSSWKGIYTQLGKVGHGFRRGYYMGGYDAEHAGELLQQLWGAIELAPQDAELHEQNRIMADHFLAAQDEKTGLFKSLWLNNAGGSKMPGHWGRCSTHDFVYLNTWFHAWVHTGQEKYRRAILRFGEAWNRIAARNGGVLPCIVRTDGSIPQQWWGEPFGYDEWGIPGVAQRGWHSWATMSVLLTGGRTDHLSGLASTVRELFKHGENGQPASVFDGKTWRTGDRLAQRRAYQITHILERMYDLTWSDESAGWVKAAGSDYGKALYFGGVTDQAAVDRFQAGARQARRRLERTRSWARQPTTGDELKRYSPGYGTGYAGFPFVDGNYWSAGYDNGRTGGVVNAPIRYFRPDGSPGLPEGVAALVRSVTADAVKLELYNAGPQAARLILTGGHYGQHRIEDISGRKVGDRRAGLELPPGALARLTVRLKRWAYRPTHTPAAGREGSGLTATAPA
ncbi:MAG: hypothetical protein AMJ81_12710 [Phycisphaerae bacterium SM23_33]|nr:MAG: hypothetical protein AMJ81_12710 [Phycisphaerae bacterium SM23_33]